MNYFYFFKKKSSCSWSFINRHISWLTWKKAPMNLSLTSKEPSCSQFLGPQRPKESGSWENGLSNFYLSYVTSLALPFIIFSMYTYIRFYKVIIMKHFEWNLYFFFASCDLLYFLYRERVCPYTSYIKKKYACHAVVAKRIIHKFIYI